MSYRSNLDILRSFAVTCVLVHHFMLTLHAQLGVGNDAYRHYLAASGHAGVLAFFVHTSLVLMYSLQRMKTKGEHVTMPFYVRRFFRIYPLAITVILIVVAFHFPYKVWDYPAPVSKAAVVANLFLVQNLFTKQQVIGPLWSLPYEVQMYVILPLLFWVASSPRGPYYLLCLIASFSAIGIEIFYRTGHLNMAAYVPCFLAGVLCYSLRHRIRAKSPPLLWMPFLVLLISAFLFANRHEEEPTFWTGWIFCLILGLAINAFRDSTMPRVNWVAKKTALYSYGIYLLHVPVLYIVFVLLGVKSPLSGVAMAILMTVAASMATYHAIESPFIEVGRRLSSPDGRDAPLDSSSTVPAP